MEGMFDLGDYLIIALVIVVAALSLLRRAPKFPTTIPTDIVPEVEKQELKPKYKIRRGVERGLLLFGLSLMFLGIAMVVEYLQNDLSEAGGTIEKVLGKLGSIFDASYRVSMGQAYHSVFFDCIAYRWFTLIELYTNERAPWRKPGEGFKPFKTATVQSMAIAGYWFTWATVIIIFGFMG